MVSETTPLRVRDSEEMMHELKQQRWFLRSASHSWLSLVLLSAIIAISYGPMLGWQALEQNMINEGCTYTVAQLDSIYSAAFAVNVAGFLPGGILFDSLGPRCLGVVGIFLSAVSLIAMGVSLMYAEKLNWLVGPSFVSVSFFSALSAWAPFIYLWILFDHPIIVNAIIAATYSFSTAIVLISVGLTSCCNVQPGLFYFVIGLLSLGMSAFVYVLLPPAEEALVLQESAVKTTMSVADQFVDTVDLDNEGNAEEEELADLDCCGQAVDCWKSERTKIYDTYIFITRLYPVAMGSAFAHLFSIYMLVMTLSLYLYAFYLTMFSESTAITLDNIYLYIYAFGGSASLVLMGVFADRVGVFLGLVVTNILCLLFLVLVLLPEFSAQVIALVVWTMLINMYFVYILRLCQIYAPSPIFGTAAGFLLFCMAISQLLVSEIFEQLISYMNDSVWAYRIQYIFWGVLTFITGCLYWWWLTKEPMPKPGESNMTSIYRARNMQRCRSCF